MKKPNKTPWVYWDFVFPVRRSNMKVLTKKIIILLSIQLIVTFFLWGLVRSSTGNESGFNSGGRIPHTISDISVFIIWFGMAGVTKFIYDGLK